MLDASGAQDLIQVIAAERAEPVLVHNNLIGSGLQDRDQFARVGRDQVPRLDEFKCFVAVRNVSISLTELHLAKHHRQTGRASGLQRGSGASCSTLRIGLVTNANLKVQNKKGGL
jgi:hypothetical protein